MEKIVIANVMRSKNKQSFFALHQINKKIKDYNPSIDVEFNIIWDNNIENPTPKEKKWIDLIDSSFNVVSYDKQFFVDYCIKTYGMDIEKVTVDFNNFFAIYVILLFHYLRRAKLYDYCLRYDDDILINYDFADVIELMLNKTSILISEPFNSNCDKVLLQKIINVYGQEAIDLYQSRNPQMLGFNSGFQGIDLSIYDDFLSTDRFELMLSLFEFKSVFDENGEEIWGPERFVIDTQEQSYASSMNLLKAKNIHILNPEEYYVAPNFGSHPHFGTLDSEDELNGWGCCLNSKISHFIGHTQGRGKPKVFLDKMDEYLKENNFL